jgi:hypothetical protein
MQKLGEKTLDVITSIIGGFLGVVFILGVMTVPTAVVLWAIETIINFLG